MKEGTPIDSGQEVTLTPEERERIELLRDVFRFNYEGIKGMVVGTAFGGTATLTAEVVASMAGIQIDNQAMLITLPAVTALVGAAGGSIQGIIEVISTRTRRMTPPQG